MYLMFCLIRGTHNFANIANYIRQNKKTMRYFPIIIWK